MKIPLRYQVSDFDCGQVALSNALNYLFAREEIPAEIVKAINLYTLDCNDENGIVGGCGTSKEAMSLIGCWLNNYAKTSDFKVRVEKLETKQVSFDQIKKCLDNLGCIIARSFLGKKGHYILVTAYDNDYVYIFDSYYILEKDYQAQAAVKFTHDKPFAYNRRVSIKRFLSETKSDYALGKITGRECVLINKEG